jgi:hypothetical protein
MDSITSETTPLLNNSISGSTISPEDEIYQRFSNGKKYVILSIISYSAMLSRIFPAFSIYEVFLKLQIAVFTASAFIPTVTQTAIELETDPATVK